MPLVSLSLARKHLRVDDPDDDEMVLFYLAAAEQAALDFMDRNAYVDNAALRAAVADGTAGDRPMVATPAVQAAVLLILGHLWENREDSVIGVSAVELPKGSRTLLAPSRIGLGV
jgi:hypothetical protein